MEKLKEILLKNKILTYALIGLVQGVVYYFAYEYMNEKKAMTGLGVFLTSLCFFSFYFGIVVKLSWKENSFIKIFSLAFVFSSLSSLLSYYTFSFGIGESRFISGDDFRLFVFNVSFIILVFITLPFIQFYVNTSSFKFIYSELFRKSWNNFFIINTSFLFLGIFWLIIALWVALFKLIDIGFFKDIFLTSEFTCIISPAIFAVGIEMTNRYKHIIEKQRETVITLFKALLPLIAFISIIFIVSILFQGLEPLWKTKKTSQILISFMLLMIFLFNGVYQGGERESTYPKYIDYLIKAMIFLMPLYSVIILYSVDIRINQYGLMPTRFMGEIIGSILFLYSAGYLISIFKKGDTWLPFVKKVNIAMVYVIILSILLINSPILDPIKSSADNQIRRLVNGKTPAKDFDYGVLKFKLGKYGREKLESLLEITDHKEYAIIKEQVEMTQKQTGYYRWKESISSKYLKEEELTIITKDNKLPDGLFEKIKDTTQSYFIDSCRKEKDCIVFSLNVDDDKELEYLFVTSGKRYYSMFLFDKNKEGEFEREGEFEKDTGMLPEKHDLIETLKNKKIKTIKNQYKNIKILDLELRLSPY